MKISHKYCIRTGMSNISKTGAMYRIQNMKENPQKCRSTYKSIASFEEIVIVVLMYGVEFI